MNCSPLVSKCRETRGGIIHKFTWTSHLTGSEMLQNKGGIIHKGEYIEIALIDLVCTHAFHQKGSDQHEGREPLLQFRVQPHQCYFYGLFPPCFATSQILSND